MTVKTKNGLKVHLKSAVDGVILVILKKEIINNLYNITMSEAVKIIKRAEIYESTLFE